MADSGALWNTPEIKALIAAGGVGPLLRRVRQIRGLDQRTVAVDLNTSASTISRLEGKRAPELESALAYARHLGVPDEVLAAAFGLRLPSHPTSPIASDPVGQGADVIRRRSFLSAAGLLLPAALMRPLDEALAGGTAADLRDPEVLASQIATARRMYDRGENRAVIACLPELLSAARAGAKTGHPDRMVQFCQINDLATDVLDKIGDVSSAHATAQNSVLIAEWTENPLVIAAAIRGLSIVFRHQGKYATAMGISKRAAETVAQTGLRTVAQARVYAQALCTLSYVAAENDDREVALDAIREAHKVSIFVEHKHRAETTPRSLADMYEVSVRWALGDAGSAIEAGSRINVASLPTPERRARFHTDMARAWWLRDRPEETAVALLSAHIQAPQEVTERPRIRAIAEELISRHHRLGVVQNLSDRLAS